MRIAKILLWFVPLWLVLDQSARHLGSFRGEWGIAVAALTLLAAIAVEKLSAGSPPREALAALGLRKPGRMPLLAAVAITLLLVCFFPAYSYFAGTGIALLPGWPLLALGMFAQGGVAEEAIFRGFVFRRLRERSAFWPAAAASTIPFFLVHALLFFELDPAAAAASLLLALVLSFPLAWLFEASGNSLWPPAIVHFAIQAPIKLVVVSEAAFPLMALWWMGNAAAVACLLFLIPRRDGARLR